MPRQSFPIKTFYGLNTESGNRDLKPGELTVATDVSISTPGIIKIAGSMPQAYVISNTVTNCVPGYGLFYFSADYDWSATPLRTRTEYLILQDGGRFDVCEAYRDGNNDWKSNDTAGTAMGVGTDDTNVYPSYFVVDGAVRICDGNFGNTNNVKKWLGYINRTHFSGLTPGGSADTYNDWLLKDAEIVAPTKGVVGELVVDDIGSGTGTEWHIGNEFDAFSSAQLVGHFACNTNDQKSVAVSGFDSATNIVTTADLGDSDVWNGDRGVLSPPAGLGFNLNTELTSVGTIPEGTYEFATSFIYDGNQESLLYELEGTVSISASLEQISCYVFATSPYNARLTGGRIYIRNVLSTEWLFFAEIDLENGVRNETSSSFTPWTNNSDYGVANSNFLSANVTVGALSTTTYEMLSGLDSGENTIHALYKTACVVNRRAYIGNVYQDGIQYGDRMLKSLVNKFDIFPPSNYVDVSVNDGDDIVLLLPFADRIFQFKRNKLHIVNISQDYEFLEATFLNKGIEYPCQATLMENGVVWCNDIGVFFYNGKELTDISVNISTDYKSFFATTSAIVGIGYDAVNNKITLCRSLDGYTATGDGDAYVFDFKTGSWTFISALFNELSNTGERTNIVTAADGEMIVFEESTSDKLYAYDDDGRTTSAVSIRTGDFDMGNPGMLKRVYGIRLSYLSAALSNIKVRAYINGDTGTAYNLYDGSALPSTSSKWSQLELNLANPLDCYSIIFDFYSSGTVNKYFKINDISIIYREKGIR